jgi:hypothetical protein
MGHSGEMSHLDDIPPWAELLRAVAAKRIDQCCVGMKVKLIINRLEPRQAALSLLAGDDSIQLPGGYLCPCGAFVLGAPGQMVVDDITTSTGSVRTVGLLIASMRQIRPALVSAPDALLRTIAVQLYGDMARQLAIQTLKWNLVPYALLGKARARPPAECWHRAG